MRLLIVDDDALVARSLKVLLGGEEDFEVLALASDGAAAVAACERYAIDIILMDIRMPGMDGLEATRRIKARWPGIHIMMLTTFEDDKSIHEALKAGAEGYLLKSAPVEGMAQKLRALMAGVAVVDAQVLRRLAEPEPVEGLSLRESEVMGLVAQGYSNKEIADRLCISEGTARNVLSSVLDKLNLRDRTQLAIYYWRRGV